MATPSKAMNIFGMILRFVLGSLFVYAGLAKIAQPHEFLQDVLQYRILDRSMALPVASLLPWLEVVFGLALVFRRYDRTAAHGLSALTVIFILALLSAWGRGLDIRCGCLGMSEAMNQYPSWIIRDLMILAGLCILLRLRPQGTGTPS